MSKEKRIYKPKSVAGFPEWLPEERLVEQRWFDHIRRVFESYGFCNIETPSVEELDVLTAKGEVDKEIYVIERLHKDEDDKSEARLALHFDQTVPMARYVAMRFNDLVFPFKRYQMQRVWRGERPQMGRMREFYQCDIDIINVDNLPLSFDAEVAAVMYEVLEGLNIGKVQLRISNRKILIGLLKELGIEDHLEILRILDKLEKIGPVEAKKLLDETPARKWSESLVQLASIKAASADELEKKINETDLNSFFLNSPEGLVELVDVINRVRKLTEMPDHAVIADLGIVRGLDYYTGTVYETQLLDVPEFTGSVCSGGRYDDLAGSYINKHLPGVGISIGFSRLFDVMRQTRPDLLGIGPKGPAHVMMTVPENEADRPIAYEAARTLRKNGVNVEMYHAPKKIGDQLKYASKKNLPYVWFVRDGKHEVKDMINQTQAEADPATWSVK
ncbi:MAG: histidine--tRNA ligase [Micavibrio aeruginosavorus]|uniref:Histidine--tRNA ligase n=1 Tax=Micavibrio aeruginosavorus TaxID=349221 RepID=A0A2W5BYP6_9BACT|nr:MAG: histidine--tRNA ligase [Micavibrio aeruginosavorus]